jgi:hypothetical protein
VDIGSSWFILRRSLAGVFAQDWVGMVNDFEGRWPVIFGYTRFPDAI